MSYCAGCAERDAQLAAATRQFRAEVERLSAPTQIDRERVAALQASLTNMATQEGILGMLMSERNDLLEAADLLTKLTEAR